MFHPKYLSSVLVFGFSLAVLLCTATLVAIAESDTVTKVVTLKSQWVLGDGGSDSHGLLLGGLSSKSGGEPSLLSMRLVREGSAWLPVWYIVLSSEDGTIQTKASGNSSELKLGPFSLSNGGRYETVISFNAHTGDTSVAVLDGVTRKKLYAGAWKGLASDKPVFPVADPAVAFAHYPWYEPVEVEWELGTNESSFVSALTVEPGTPLWARVKTQTKGNGYFQVVVGDGAAARTLATAKAESGELMLPLPADALTALGPHEMRLEYVSHGDAQFVDERRVIVGSITGSIDSVRLDHNSGELRGTVRLNTDSFLHGLEMELTAHIEAMEWDDRRQMFTPRAHGILNETRGSLRSTVFLQPGSNNIPVAFRTPEEPGVWRLRFALSVKPGLSVNWTSSEFLFSTATPDKLTAMQGERLPVPNDDSTVRVCTYNILGFQGYPETEAAAALGGPTDQRRIDHFKEVFSHLGCDIFGVQEGGSATMLERLAEALEMNVAVYRSTTIYLGGMFSRFPILESRSFNNPYVSGGPFSRFAGASLLDIDGESTWVVNLHAYPHTQEMRVQEAKVLGDAVDELLQVSPRVIVLGDFNSRVGEVIHQALTERGFVNALEVSSKNGVPSIDHIYVSSDLRSRVEVGWIVRDPGFALHGMEGPGIWAHSDHVPTVVELQWK